MTRSAPNFSSDADVIPVIGPGQTYATVTEKISSVVLRRPITRGYAIAFLIAFSFLMLFNFAVCYLFYKGVGIWGINIPVAWGFAIVNFVWWIGIGHAGTFISAFLLLLKQDWRTSINRFAEAMTLFAVACAGMFPLLHLGRPWLFYWLLPYPNVMYLWPQFRSPLVWDVFAVSTYGTVSLIFWYIGLIPDLATLRDRAQNKIVRIVYGILALGWRGSVRHWRRYRVAYLLLAGLCAPLVVSVHSVVGMDFAGGIVPGWHSTIFPPYFVAGAIFSGFAMVITLAVPMRKFLGLEDFITIKHIDNSAKLMLVTGLIVGYGYATEAFMGWFSGDKFEQYMTWNRAFGPYGWSYAMLMFCNVCTTQVLWIKRIRQNPLAMWFVALIIQTGMWLERFVIVVTTLTRDFPVGKWGSYFPTFWDWATLLGTMGLFTTLFFLFIRVLPAIAISEMRELVHHRQGHAAASEEALMTQIIAPQSPLFGYLAEFDTPEALIEATRKTHQAGYTLVDAYSPMPVDGLEEALGLPSTRIPLLVFIGGTLGALTGFGMCWYANVLSYPWNIGGRPFNSWPAWIPITFELTVLFSAFSAALGMLIRNGLPEPYHPVFNVERFNLASQERFFLVIESRDPKFQAVITREFLQSLHAQGVLEVPR